MSDFGPSTELTDTATGAMYTLFAIPAPASTPRFLQGVFPFAGRGVYETAPLSDGLAYVVPKNSTAQVIYFRAGNLSDDILYLTLTVDSVPIRYFPVGPKSDTHIPLAIVESYPVGSRIEVCLGASRGLTGAVVIDVGILETRVEETK